MELNKIHYNYSILLAVNIKYWEGGYPLSRDNLNGVDSWKSEFLYNDKKVFLERFIVEKDAKWFLVLNNKKFNINWFLNEYLIDLELNNLTFPKGGVFFLDNDSREVIKTNYDMGESEEWESIFRELKSNGKVLHTFSSTDEAIELLISNEDVSLQNLDWEAMPNRLESSRKSQPIHIFTGSKFFLSQIDECIKTIKNIYAELEKRNKEDKDTLFSYFSVTYRSDWRKSQEDWINT
jgi:hypothetical protein